MQDPGEEAKVTIPKPLTPSKLNTSKRDTRFLNFINSWVQRFNQDRHAQVMTGSDFTIDFELMGLHPLSSRGREFIDYVRNKFR